MTALINDPTLARLFLGSDGGSNLAPVIGGTMETWNATTYANTVRVGSVVYSNLPVVNPSALSTGTVLLLKTEASLVVLGRIYSA